MPEPVSYRGKVYEVPSEKPEAARSPDLLWLHFAPLILDYMAFAQSKLTHMIIGLAETRRTTERQAWLYAQGRSAPFLDEPQVSWTMDSYHLYGLAADLYMARRDNPSVAIYDPKSWGWLLHIAPPEVWGLKNLAPKEQVHFEHAQAAQLLRDREHYGITGP